MGWKVRKEQAGSGGLPQLPWRCGSVVVSDRGGGYLEVSIPYAIRHLAQDLGTRRFDGETKTWILRSQELPAIVEAVRRFFGQAEPPVDVVRREIPRIAAAVGETAQREGEFLAARYEMSAEEARAVAAYGALRGALDAWERAFMGLPRVSDAFHRASAAFENMLAQLPAHADLPIDVYLSETGDLESEQVILGSLLVDNRILTGIQFLRAEHFADSVHSVIFRAIGVVSASGKVADPATVVEVSAEVEGLADAINEVGGPQYIEQLVTVAVPKRAEAIERAKLVRDAHERKVVLDACATLKAAFSPGEPGNGTEAEAKPEEPGRA